MRRVVVIFFVVSLGLSLAFALYRPAPDIPSAGVLVVELGGALAEAPPVDRVSQLLAPGPALPTILLQLEKAALDDRVRGVLIHIRPLGIGYARVQELRDAMLLFREHQKPVAALLDMTSLNTTREMYLASAADQVYLVPGFAGPLAGIAGEYLFLGELMDKIGVRYEYERIGDYKTAPEMFAERQMSPPARRMMNEILDTLFEQVIRGIALGRNLDSDKLRALVDTAPSTTASYLQEGLADGVASREEVIDLLGGDEAEEISLDTYVEVDPRDFGLRTGPAVALIFGEGVIVQSQSRRSFGSSQLAADRVVEALKDASSHPDVRAIVLRINSPGGSPLASDQIWRAVRSVQEETPVVVSFADVAASGGYYVASAANAVVTQPATLTGSIGVVLQRPSFQGLYQKLGVHSEVMTRGRQASILAASEPLTEEQRAITRSVVETIYEQFLERVAEGRGMTTAQIDAVGQGRVWLGEKAHTLGLADEIGGLRKAVERAKREAGLEPDVDPRRMVFPGRRNLTEQLAALLRGTIGLSAREALEQLGVDHPLLDWGETFRGGPLLVPSGWLEIH
ncbi:MAG: signal peptide peptidase SppA [Myxococcota bacterium]